MRYDIDEQRGHRNMTRWRAIECETDRFATRSETARRATQLNDEAAGIVRDKVAPRWRNEARRAWKAMTG